MSVLTSGLAVTSFAALGLGLAISSAGAASTKPTPREIVAMSQPVAPGGIKELKAVEINGVPQWISVRGNNPANPILLFVHGGPGSPMMPESWTFQRPWEDFFTVVQWDQRGAGKTFAAAKRKPDPSLSLNQVQSDAEQLIELLLRTYGKSKLFLMGHSWGSILGVKVAQHRPDLLYAYIGVGQVVNGRRNEIVGYQQTMARARASGNSTAVKELQALAPYPGAADSVPLSKVVIERKWDRFFGGMVYGKTDDDSSFFAELSPDYTSYDVKSAEEGEEVSVQRLLGEAVAASFDDVTSFQCPVFLFAGVEDRTTPTTLVEEYYARIQAPQKKLFKIERAAHYVVNEAPGVVLLDLVTQVRPVFEAIR